MKNTHRQEVAEIVRAGILDGSTAQGVAGQIKAVPGLIPEGEAVRIARAEVRRAARAVKGERA